MTKLTFFKLHSDAHVPKKATAGSACFDLIFEPGDRTLITIFGSNNNEFERPIGRERTLILMPGERALLPTSLIADIPQGHSIRFHPRSGYAIKRGLTLANAEAVIDSDYVEEMFVAILNISQQRVLIHVGERVAQGELVADLQYDMGLTRKRPEQKTERNGGFGSTGE